MTSASSFIDRIKIEYREVTKAEQNALPHAIKCGELLILAQENLAQDNSGKNKIEKVKWLDWLRANCPEIAQETASLYMRLAKNKDKLGKAKSIRHARELLPKTTTRAPQPKSNAIDEPLPPTKEDKKLKMEEELKVVAPDEMCEWLVETWEDDDLALLAKLIGDHLQQKKISNAVINPSRVMGQPTFLPPNRLTT
jgi:hypothetical protein